MLVPPISKYVTRQPWTIRPDAKLSQAHQLMREHRIHYLPVLDGDRVVGLLSERDIERIEKLGPTHEPTVAEAMNVDVYAAHVNDPVDDVLGCMAAHDFSSAVVLDLRAAVEGIFLPADGVHALADLMHRVMH